MKLSDAPRAIPREDDFSSWLRSPAVTARVGFWLGITFGLAFVTGLISHWAQTPSPWLAFPTSPSWGYRVTQGVHVIAGTAAVPLLLVKLWTVFPKLLARPPREVRELVLHGLERVSIAVLVAAAIFQLVTGLANAAQWYPWHFDFRATHYALGWIAIGSLVVHIAVKLPIIRTALASDVDSTAQDRAGTAAGRRGHVAARPAAHDVGSGRGRGAGDGRHHGPLAADRLGAGGPVRHGTPGCPDQPHRAYRGVVAGRHQRDVPTDGGQRRPGGRSSRLAALRRCRRRRRRSRSRASRAGAPVRTWTGVPVRHLLELVDAPAGSEVLVESLQEHGGVAGELHSRGTSPTTRTRCWHSTWRASRSRSTTASPAG